MALMPIPEQVPVLPAQELRAELDELLTAAGITRMHLIRRPEFPAQDFGMQPSLTRVPYLIVALNSYAAMLPGEPRAERMQLRRREALLYLPGTIPCFDLRGSRLLRATFDPDYTLIGRYLAPELRLLAPLPPASPVVHRLLTLLAEERCSALECTAAATLILGRLRSLLDEPGRVGRGPERSWLAIRSFVDEHHAADLDRAVVARRFGISERHLSHLFRSQGQTTFTTYVTERRLQHARQLLATSGLSIADIAAACGFASGTYFARLYKRRFGHAPSQA